MATEKVGVTYEVKDKATKNLNRVQKGFERTSKSVRETGDVSGKTSKSMGTLGKTMGQLKSAAVPVGVAIAAVTGGFIAAKKVVDASVEAFREQDEANRSLKVGLRTVYTNARDVDQAFQDLQPTIADLATSTMFGDEQIAKMAGSFLTATDGAKATAKDLELIADIAEGTGQSAEKAAQQYARALNGELSPRLARMIGITEDGVKALDSIEDATERAAAVQKTFGDRIGGAATKIDPYLRALKNIEDAQGDIQQAFGQSITENQNMVDALEDTHVMLREIESFVKDGGLDPLVDKLGETTGEAVELLAAYNNLRKELETETEPEWLAWTEQVADLQRYTTALYNPLEGLRLLWNHSSDAAKDYNDSLDETVVEIKDLGDAWDESKDAWNGLTDSMTSDWDQELKDKLTDLKTEFENNPVMAFLGGQTQTMEFTAKEVDEFNAKDDKEDDAAKKSAEERSKALQDSKDSLALAQVRTEEERIAVKLAQKIASIREDAKSDQEAENRIKVANIEAGREYLAVVDRRADERQRSREEAEAEAKADAEQLKRRLEEVALETSQQKVAGLKLDLLGEEDRLTQLRLEKKIALEELNRKGLEGDKQRLANAKIEKQYQEGLLDIERKKNAERGKAISSAGQGISSAAGNTASMFGDLSSEVGAGYEEKIQKLSEVEGEFAKRRIEQLKEQKELEQENLKLLQEKINAFGDLSDAGGQLGTALSDLASKQWDFSNATDATQAGLEAVSAAGGAAAGLLGDTVKEQAGIKAGFEAAAAAGAWGLALTTQNPAFYAAAVKHTTAAGMYGAVAGGAGSAGSGASGGGVSGGSSGGSQAPRMPDMNKAVAANKKAFLEALRESQNEQRSTTVINDFRGATLLERDPTTNRRARDVLNQSDRYRVGGQ